MQKIVAFISLIFDGISLHCVSPMSFPQGYFFIKSRASDQVLDIPSRDAGQNLVITRQRNSDNDSQLWSFDNGFLINKNSKRGG